MSVTQKVEYECDLCERKKSTKHEVPNGWVQISLDGFLDRTWIEKVICSECLAMIDRKRKVPQ